MFEIMIQDWFSGNDNYNYFIKALLLGDLKAMNTYMKRFGSMGLHFYGKKVLIGG